MVKCNTTRDSAYSSFGLAPTASLFSSLFMDCLLYHRQSRGSNSFASRASRSLVLSSSLPPLLSLLTYFLVSFVSLFSFLSSLSVTSFIFNLHLPVSWHLSSPYLLPSLFTSFLVLREIDASSYCRYLDYSA